MSLGRCRGWGRCPQLHHSRVARIPFPWSSHFRRAHILAPPPSPWGYTMASQVALHICHWAPNWNPTSGQLNQDWVWGEEFGRFQVPSLPVRGAETSGSYTDMEMQVSDLIQPKVIFYSPLVVPRWYLWAIPSQLQLCRSPLIQVTAAASGVKFKADRQKMI